MLPKNGLQSAAAGVPIRAFLFNFLFCLKGLHSFYPLFKGGGGEQKSRILEKGRLVEGQKRRACVHSCVRSCVTVYLENGASDFNYFLHKVGVGGMS